MIVALSAPNLDSKCRGLRSLDLLKSTVFECFQAPCVGTNLLGCQTGDTAVSINWGARFVAVLRMRALLFGVYSKLHDL